MLGYFLASMIGISLGLMGGGGSILTVPILVYAMNMDPKLSIALSLAIVGVTSLLGVFGHLKRGNVNLKIAAIFGPLAMVGTFFGARLSKFLTGEIQLLLFGVIMLMASFFMLRKKKGNEEEKEESSEIKKKLNIPLIIAEGLFVGVVTGLVGVGGGFLIVPALVLLAGIPMKQAVGTSLLIISLKSFSGFLGYFGLVEIPWNFLFGFTTFSGAGIFLGIHLVKYFSQEKLKRTFGVFLIMMGVFILYKNSSKYLNKEPTKAAVIQSSHKTF